MISCLTVTKNSKKFPYLKRAIKSYCDQTHIDKELVILCGDYDFHKIIDNYVNYMRVPNCKVVFIDEDGLSYKLGDMRNISISSSSGDYIVNWDDDDINHPLRLETQFNFLMENNLDACFLSDQLHYFYDTNELFWVNWCDGIPGTIMCKKECFNEIQHPSTTHHEDGDVKEKICNKFKSKFLGGVGYLYMYSYNDLCVFDREHHINEIVRRKDLSYMKNIYTKIKAIKYIKYYDIKDYSFNITNELLT